MPAGMALTEAAEGWEGLLMRLVMAMVSFAGFSALNYGLASQQILQFATAGTQDEVAGLRGSSSQRFMINISVSLVHASLCSVAMWRLGVVSFVTDTLSSDDHTSLLLEKVPSAAALAPFSLGYLVYDTLDLRRERLGADMAVHHAVSIAFTAVVVVFQIAGAFWLLVLTCEFNSVFLHLRTLLKATGFQRRGPVYLACLSGLATTFFWSRLYLHGRGYYCTLCLLMISRQPMHVALSVTGTVGGTAIGILNVKLLGRLLRSELGSRSRKE